MIWMKSRLMSGNGRSLEMYGLFMIFLKCMRENFSEKRILYEKVLPKQRKHFFIYFFTDIMNSDVSSCIQPKQHSHARLFFQIQDNQ